MNDIVESFATLDVHNTRDDRSPVNASRRQTSNRLPTRKEIIERASQLGYEQSNNRPTKNGVLYFTYTEFRGTENKINIHVWFNTKTVMTNVNHPRHGRKQLFRKDAYTNIKTLSVYFVNPRVHTEFGYSSKMNAKAICNSCAKRLYREEFSENEWKKVGRNNESVRCIQCMSSNYENQIYIPVHRKIQSHKVISKWLDEGKKSMVSISKGVATAILETTSSRFDSKLWTKPQSTVDFSYALQNEDAYMQKKNWRSFGNSPIADGNQNHCRMTSRTIATSQETGGLTNAHNSILSFEGGTNRVENVEPTNRLSHSPSLVELDPIKKVPSALPIMRFVDGVNIEELFDIAMKKDATMQSNSNPKFLVDHKVTIVAHSDDRLINSQWKNKENREKKSTNRRHKHDAGQTKYRNGQKPLIENNRWTL